MKESDKLIDMINKKAKEEGWDLGATGTHSKGKIHRHDEGDIKLAMGCDLDKQLLYIHFGSPVVWLALDRTDALNFVKTMMKQVRQLKKEPKK